MRFPACLCLAATLALNGPALAQPAQTPAAPAAPAAEAPQSPPKLLVVISVDQFSTDLFGAYRSAFTGGLARLQQGVVFPNGYQGHAATETCPGHSTILTGSRPARTGIIGNDWIDQKIARADKTVYCAEDPDVPGTSSRDYAPSVKMLRVPTLGGYMKAQNPAAKVVSVSGKDRSAIMMGGPVVDQIWWWGGNGFTSYRGTPLTPLIEQVNAGVRKTFDQPRPAMDVPAFCKASDRAVRLTDTLSVGDGHFARAGGDARAFRTSPEADAAVLALAVKQLEAQQLGRGDTTDLLIVGLSATDYIGHSYGNRGAEMCIQMFALDDALASFLDRLDATGLDYMVMLTADHGGPDIPERLREQAVTDAERADPALYPSAVSAAISARTGITVPQGTLLLGTNPFGDIYVNAALTAAQRTRVIAEAKAFYAAHRQVEAVFTRKDIEAAPAPTGSPESWSLATIAKASYDPERSGDLVLLLKPRIMPIATPAPGYVSTHGSPWGYDRRVPMLFWRKGLMHMEQPQAVETVDILPTLAAQIGVTVPADRIDGRCLDLDPGPASRCPAPQDR
ncbi:alkaline phosphatase family protein [Sphingobium sp. B12D2B]|uniref:alkaline phosphatase family protein n=1 Tax=Sphingobium sp. B12D2B TaxID=2940577 RepID=UPI002225807D|nr:alkaline phosphatase family protein [Sphingobium sp. B12D2B]MCW2350831.1 putative AlkP superfamily pyrophosphatase or phosphodiesterase [Sphingobium sp. B12D2B]